MPHLGLVALERPLSTRLRFCGTGAAGELKPNARYLLWGIKPNPSCPLSNWVASGTSSLDLEYLACSLVSYLICWSPWLPFGVFGMPCC